MSSSGFISTISRPAHTCSLYLKLLPKATYGAGGDVVLLVINRESHLSYNNASPRRLFRLQTSVDSTEQIIDHYISSSAPILLADCILYDSLYQWHIQAITLSEIQRDRAGWLSETPLLLIGETLLQLCLTIEG